MNSFLLQYKAGKCLENSQACKSYMCVSQRKNVGGTLTWSGGNVAGLFKHLD